MGTVYRARDPGLDRLVALKTITGGAVDSEEAKERFFREARAAARLQHPNIVTVYEAGDFEGALYIAMELLEGQDLSDVLKIERTIPEKVRIIIEICNGLDYAHKRGVIHRDIKPANIRLLPDGKLKIVDFGIARLADAGMTRTGIILGTPSYVSPEMLAGDRFDHRADQWAVGIVLYELLAGRRPFSSREFTALARQIIQDPLPPLEETAPGLPAGLAAITARALSKSPHDRYHDLARMAWDLSRAIGLPVPKAAPEPEASRRRSYEETLEEAKRSLAALDLESALSAARRAQALEPSGREVVQLIARIEAKLDATDTPPTLVHVPVVATMERLGAAAFRDLGTFGEPPATQTAAFSPVDPVIALAGTDGAVRLWDLTARRRLGVLRTEMHLRAGHDARAVCVAFSPNGKRLATGHVDGAIHFFDLTREEEVPVKLRHEEMVSCLGFSPNGATLASGGTDTNLKLWEVAGCEAGDSRRELYRQPSPVTALTYSEDGKRLVTAHTNRVLRVLDAATVRLTATLRGPEAPVNLLRLDPRGERLAAASQDRLLRIFDLTGGGAPVSLGPFRKPLTSACFFPDGRHLATVGQENVVQIWNLDTRTSLASLYGAAEDAFVAVSLYGATGQLAAALADGRTRLWSPA